MRLHGLAMVVGLSAPIFLGLLVDERWVQRDRPTRDNPRVEDMLHSSGMNKYMIRAPRFAHRILFLETVIQRHVALLRP